MRHAGDWLALFLSVFVCTLAGLYLFNLFAPECPRHYQAWDRLQESIADCREDPDCYLTLADLERVRELAPRVAACEAREGEE